MLKNDRMLRALRMQPLDRTPIWLMRQAGRYLPEYRKTRERAGGFLDMVKNPALACEVTLQPLKRFQLDAAIVFSDILTIPDALGLGLSFVEGEGPKFKRPIRTAYDIAQLPTLHVQQALSYVFDTTRLVCKELNNHVPLIGFSGSPWTLACYMVEGATSKQYTLIKKMAFTAPDLLHRLLGILTDIIIEYLKLQRENGAQILQLFDTWGGILSPGLYKTFSLPYLQRIARELKRGEGIDRTPLLLYGRGNGAYIADLIQTGAEAISVDWTVDLAKAASEVSGRMALQGNLDPAVLYTTPKIIEQEAKQVLENYARGNRGALDGHIFNLGHGMEPNMQPDHVTALIEAVHTHSKR